jgi:hypothetical protein
MRKLLKNRYADMNMILAAIVMAIVFAIGIIIVYNVLATVDMGDVDDDIQANMPDHGSWNTTTTLPGSNSTTDLIDNVNTFYTVGPIALIVVAAVGILSYVLLLRRK